MADWIVRVFLLCLCLWPHQPAHADGRDVLTVGLGAVDVLDTDALAGEGYMAYRFAPRLFADRLGDVFHGIGPMVGWRGNTDGGLFGYGDAFLDLRPSERLVLWPSVGIGGYRAGDSRDLGGVFQFHLEVFAGYRVAERHMLGVSFQHVSNAGLHEKNPGTNSIFVTYSIALPPVF